MEIKWTNPAELHPYENNTKTHPPEQVDRIAESIKQFGWQQPIVVDADNVVIIGHGRLLAAKQLMLDKVPVVCAEELTEEQAQALRLADNKTNESPWDFGKLEEELAALSIAGFDMTAFGFDDLEKAAGNIVDSYGDGKENKGNLIARFNVPPFSVLDARQGYWKEKKEAWLQITGDLSETRDGEFGKISDGNGMLDSINGGTSNFDPVLAETMYKWFCPAKGKILDPFGGEQTKGVVAGELGFEYVACEIRQDQVDLNMGKVAQYPGVRYVCGDSNQIKQHIPERGFDMLFTSPPYYDLEVYSKEDMSALGTYEEFMRQYRNIFEQCFEMLADNTFAVVKVGEIRNKKTGEYRSFVADNVKLLTDIGFKFYNDIVLVTPVGTAQFRAGNSMKSRKVVKCHQNVLVFYKGDLKQIQAKFPEIEFEDVPDGEEDETYVF